jgi:hypothetical protein
MSVCNDVITNSRYVISHDNIIVTTSLSHDNIIVTTSLSHDNIIVTTSQSVNECSVFLNLKDSTKITRCCTLRRAKNTPTRSFVSKSHCKQEVDVR